jgi:hypothetical protein
VRNVGLLAREEIIEADDIVPFLDQPFAKMGTEETGSAGHQNSMNLSHSKSFSRISALRKIFSPQSTTGG